MIYALGQARLERGSQVQAGPAVQEKTATAQLCMRHSALLRGILSTPLALLLLALDSAIEDDSKDDLGNVAQKARIESGPERLDDYF